MFRSLCSLLPASAGAAQSGVLSPFALEKKNPPAPKPPTALALDSRATWRACFAIYISTVFSSSRADPLILHRGHPIVLFFAFPVCPSCPCVPYVPSLSAARNAHFHPPLIVSSPPPGFQSDISSVFVLRLFPNGRASVPSG